MQHAAYIIVSMWYAMCNVFELFVQCIAGSMQYTLQAAGGVQQCAVCITVLSTGLGGLSTE